MCNHKNTNNNEMEAPDSGISVRMYNPGFGDCFLLAFRSNDGHPRYMLIDFGVHHQYKDYEDRKKRMQLIAKDICEATDGHLDVVAITHEHTDHLYGFKYAREEFDDIEIDNLWLAWTEDPRDPVAKELKQLYGVRINAVKTAVGLLQRSDSALAKKILNLPSFEDGDTLASVGENGNTAQIDYLRSKSKNKLKNSADYRHPGEPPLTISDVPGVKVYVLAPPKDVKWIRSLEKKKELYPEMVEMNAFTSFSAAVLAAGEGDSFNMEDNPSFKLSLPFDDIFAIKKQDLFVENIRGVSSEYKKFFKDHYGFGDEDNGPEWRQIETDWLNTAEQLALSINSKTNNTSLVLAFELTQCQPHKVLLFVGDAQTGNWLSWHENGLSWPGEQPGDDPITAEYLLHRTVFYKLGHHGSHNATLKEKGLEMMTSPDLVAMIPVDQIWAKDTMDWNHPAKKLYERLIEKTEGRIIRSDLMKPEKPENVPADEWKAFEKQISYDSGQDKLWVQFTVEA